MGGGARLHAERTVGAAAAAAEEEAEVSGDMSGSRRLWTHGPRDSVTQGWPGKERRHQLVGGFGVTVRRCIWSRLRVPVYVWDGLGLSVAPVSCGAGV